MRLKKEKVYPTLNETQKNILDSTLEFIFDSICDMDRKFKAKAALEAILGMVQIQ